jgi:hypothetical protein
VDDTIAAWNVWGVGVEEFTDLADDVRCRAPSCELTWGGLVVLAATDERAQARADALHAPANAIVGSPPTVAGVLLEYVAAGATTLVLGPVDASNIDNVALVAEVRALLQE